MTERRAELVTGDCLEVLAAMPADSVDAVVTDPPYGLEFMGKDWDSFAPTAIRRSGWDHAGGQHGVADLELGRDHHPGAAGRIAYHKRRSTYRCPDCGRRDAFRNPHGDCSGDWLAEYVDAEPLEARAFQAWCEQWGREVLRVLRPGGHLLSFGGTRTFHRMTAGLEDAGFEIRDCVVWAYAQGFPKSHDVSKAIDRAAGLERPVIGSKLGRPGMARDGSNQRAGFDSAFGGEASGPLATDITGPASEAAAKWSGWGTALKPAWEPIVLARRPLAGTVAENVLRYGTGALNVDGARIPISTEDAEAIAKAGGYLGDGYVSPEGVALEGSVDGSLRAGRGEVEAHQLGRWPANVVLTDPIFDGDVDGVVGGGGARSSGHVNESHEISSSATVKFSGPSFAIPGVNTYGDTGTYSRFFLIPKADRAEREPITSEADQRVNTHPTVKPLELMRHLVRLVTPPGGVVLDPFLGSGTTALAAELEGFGWLGIERDPAYVAIAEARLRGWQRGLGLDVPAPTRAAKAANGHWPASRPAGGTWSGHAGQEALEERTERTPSATAPEPEAGLFD